MKRAVPIILLFYTVVFGQTGMFDTPERIMRTEGKSLMKAALYSLVLPGSGEYYLGKKGRAYGFMAAEAVIWVGYAGMLTQSRMLEDEYKAYGAQNAGMDPSGKDDTFFEYVGQYDSRYEYNLYTILGERSYSNAYPETPEYYWSWDSNEDRAHYDDLRVRSDRSERNSTIILAAAGINRLISVIDVIRIGTYGTASSDFTLNVHAVPANENLGIILSLTKEF